MQISKATAVLLASVPPSVAAWLLGNETVDVQLHDTYFVIGKQQAALGSSLLLVAYGLSYRALRNYRTVGLLTLVHIGATVITVLALPALNAGWIAAPPTRFGYEPLPPGNINWVKALTALMVFASPTLLLCNTLVGAYRGRK